MCIRRRFRILVDVAIDGREVCICIGRDGVEIGAISCKTPPFGPASRAAKVEKDLTTYVRTQRRSSCTI